MKRLALGTLMIAMFVMPAIFLTGCFRGGGGGPIVTPHTTVIFHLNGGEPTATWPVVENGRVTQDVYESNKESFNPIAVRRDRWIFEGWYLDQEFTTRFQSLPLGNQDDVNLWARWTDRVVVTPQNFTQYFTVSARWNGLFQVPGSAVNITVTPRHIIDPTRSTEDITLRITPLLPPVPDGGANNGWVGTPSTSLLLNSNDFHLARTINFPAATIGVTFALQGSFANVVMDQEYFVMYLLPADDITVSLNLNGGQGTEQVTVRGGDTLQTADLVAPTREGHRFMGWYNNDAFTTRLQSIQVTRPRTLYARWTQEHTVTFNTNGGTAMEPLVFLQGTQLQLGSDPTRDGFGFYGWFTDAELTVRFTDTTATRSVTLFAKWEYVRTITFVTNGGSEKAPVTALNTTVPNLGANPTRSGFVFNGWFTDPALTTRYQAQPILGDITLYARWAVRQTLTLAQVESMLDITATMERGLVNGVQQLFTTFEISIRPEFRHIDFSIEISVFVDYRDSTRPGVFLGEASSGRFFMGTSGGNFTVVRTSNPQTNTTAFWDADHIDNIRLSLNWSNIYLPEGFILP